jgi:DNA-directed RNA polymerase sigma subunit (sigma70/sigma32)
MTTYHRTHLNTVLYRAYEKWAVSKAVAFRSIHKQKCTNIATEELVFASKIGLFKAIQKYNGKSDLSYFSSIYVQSELLRLVTDTYSMSILPKSIRRQKKEKNNDTPNSQLYNHLLTVRPFSMYEPWKIELMGALRNDFADNAVDKYETTETIRAYLDTQPLFVKRLFLLYMNYWSGTNRPPSQKYLAEMMCCSEETVRQNTRL